MSDQNFWNSRIKEGAVLSPIDRTGEVLFGLIMVLTFTGTISVAESGREEVRDLLWSALGCNLAWGIVDAMMFLMNILYSRGHGILVIRKFMGTTDPKAARKILREEMPPVFSALLKEEDLDNMGARLRQVGPPANRILLSGPDFVAGFQIFLLVFLCTFPVALPFALVNNVQVGMRISNGVALILLFIGGYRLARYAGLRPWFTAVMYALIGLVMVSLTMALGG